MYVQSKCMRTLFEMYMSPFGASSACFLNRDTCDKHAIQRTEHGNQPIYQTENFKHIQVILHMTIKSWMIRTGSHQLPGPPAGLLLPVKFYIAGIEASLPGSPVSQESEK